VEKTATVPQTDERSRSARRLTRKQVQWIAGGTIVAIAAAYMILSAAQGSVAFYLTISELQQRGPQERRVRVSGFVVEDSIVWEPRDLDLQFQMVDDSGMLPVAHTGARPDMFRDGAELIVEGRLRQDGVFEATTLILKCPSKYEEAD